VDHWSPTKPSPQEIYERLFRNKELICLRIKWTGGGAHFTTIRGCTDPSVGGPFIVSTSDTLEGFSGSTLSYDDFRLKYHIGGERKATYWTSGRFAPARSCGFAESVALDVNRNGNSVSLQSRDGDLPRSVGKVDRLMKTLAWDAEAVVGKGVAGGIGIDDAATASWSIRQLDSCFSARDCLTRLQVRYRGRPRRVMAPGAPMRIAALLCNRYCEGRATWRVGQ
jgi:hypothetical protein